MQDICHNHHIHQPVPRYTGVARPVASGAGNDLGELI